jgi:hypothetical protein
MVGVLLAEQGVLHPDISCVRHRSAPRRLDGRRGCVRAAGAGISVEESLDRVGHAPKGKPGQAAIGHVEDSVLGPWIKL